MCPKDSAIIITELSPDSLSMERLWRRRKARSAAVQLTKPPHEPDVLVIIAVFSVIFIVKVCLKQPEENTYLAGAATIWRSKIKTWFPHANAQTPISNQSTAATEIRDEDLAVSFSYYAACAFQDATDCFFVDSITCSPASLDDS